MCLLKRHISIINPQNPICIKGVSWKNTFHILTNLDLYYKCLMNLTLYWKCLFKRHLYNSKKFEFILEVSLEETHSTIPQISMYTKGVFLRDTSHNFINFNLYYMSLKFDFILKVSFQKTPSIIPKKLDLYWRCVFKIHLPQFHKIQ